MVKDLCERLASERHPGQRPLRSQDFADASVKYRRDPAAAPRPDEEQYVGN